jgi:ABC-type transport system, involved in lipoprotein release, permease component
MKILDLFMMSIGNLKRRKLRTFLTVLGVVIGTASIVVMVSLGIGMNQAMIDQISSSGSLTAITVMPNYGWGMELNAEPQYLTDDVVRTFQMLPNTERVSPRIRTMVIMFQNGYEGYVSLIGVDRQTLEKIPLKEGQLNLVNSKDLTLVVGSGVILNFYNSKTGAGYWDTGEVPNIDFMGQPMFTIFDMDAYYQAQSGMPNVKVPKKYMLNATGMIEGNIDEYNEYTYDIYVDIELLKTQLRLVFGKNPIPGQPTTSKGKPYPYFVYDEVIVYADEMNNVVELQKSITDMGYTAYSNMEYLESMKQQSQTIQAVLGGIGAVSMFVAAIGIANTMMMSIYERTKEIGIIKVLGCAMRNIQTMFLLEAAFIGFLGGMIGLLLSYIISILLNMFFSAAFFAGSDGRLSLIPTWLALLSLAFAMIVGMIAGFFPALRAMKLSPLAAIKTE